LRSRDCPVRGGNASEACQTASQLHAPVIQTLFAGNYRVRRQADLELQAYARAFDEPLE
jgi:hypothetical protein